MIGAARRNQKHSIIVNPVMAVGDCVVAQASMNTCIRISNIIIKILSIQESKEKTALKQIITLHGFILSVLARTMSG